MKKTILIAINRGSLARNILRSGVLENLLEHDNVKVVIILNTKIPEYFRQEFSHPNIILEDVKKHAYNRLRKIFIVLFNQLIYSETERLATKFGSGNRAHPSYASYLLKHAVFSTISRISFLKYIARFLEQYVFREKDYDYLFEKYNPSLVFCTSLYSRGLDLLLIKAAKRFGVLSVSMPKSWDTVSRLFYAAPSDKFIVNNELMKKHLIDEQLIKERDIYVVGFPQFDAYAKKTDFLSKNDFCKLTSLDERKPIILYASEGLWTYWDDKYIYDFVHNRKILEKYNLIVRPHFSDVQKNRYEYLKIHKGLYIDNEHLDITNMFRDAWDPTKKNIDWLANTLFVSDVVITTVSTFVLDAMVFDKPIINICYDIPLPKKSSYIPLAKQYSFTHFQGIMKRKPTLMAKSALELMECVKWYVENPKLLYENRKKTLTDICYKVDGRASERIASALLYLLYDKR